MLETIRSRSSGIFAWAIAILIILAMAFFGVNTYVGHGTDPAIYKDGENSVTLSQYRAALQQAQQRALSQNQEVDISSLPFKRLVLEQLIGQTMLQSLSQSGGYVAADESVAKLIVQNSAFQVDGKFDQETYDQFVLGSYGSKERYENLLKQNLAVSQVSSGIVESALSLPNKHEQLVQLVSEKRSIDLVTVMIEDVQSEIEVTNQQIDEFYEENKLSYLEPEKLSVEYITLAAKSFEEGIEIDDVELQQLYEENIETYTSPETRNVRHILFIGADAEDKASQALAELNEGKPFEELAELSEDVGSAQNGGDLGEVSKGQMVEAFEQAAFALPINEVSEPVSTEFGFHLIEVTAINGGEAQTFDEVKEELLQSTLTQRAEDQFFEQAEILRNATFENQDTLQVAADDLGLYVETSEFFSRVEGSGYFNNPAIRSTAFSEEVLNQNLNSGVIEVTPTEFIVLRKAEFRPEAPQPLEAVVSQVTDALKNNIAAEQTKEKIDSAYDQIIESEDWQGVIDELGLTSDLVTMSYLDQQTQTPSNVVAEIFSSSTEGAYGSRIGKSFDLFGNAYLFQLNNVESSSLEGQDAQIADAIQNVILMRNSAAVSQKFVQAKVQEALEQVDFSLL